MTPRSAPRRVLADALTPSAQRPVASNERAWSSFCHEVDRTRGRNWALSVSPRAESPARLVNAEMRPEPSAMTASRELFLTVAGEPAATVLDQGDDAVLRPASEPRFSQGFATESSEASSSEAMTRTFPSAGFMAARKLSARIRARYWSWVLESSGPGPP